MTTTYGIGDVVEYQHRLWISVVDNNCGNTPNESPQHWMSYIDPITLVYNALVDVITTNRTLCSMVRVGNIIAYSRTSDRAPEKDTVSTSDMPEIRVVPISGNTTLISTTSTSTLIRQFRYVVSTGDQRIDMGLFAIEWELYRALHMARSTLSNIEFRGTKFVKNVKIQRASASLTDTSMDHGIRGWLGLYDVECELWFPTTSCLA